jgi:cytochrome P450
MNIFEQATILKLRFPSARGELSVENLWDLPLTSKTVFDLDTIAKSVNASLKASGEESFVKTEANPAVTRLTLMLDILKHIIATKLAANEADRKRSDRNAERQKLLSILANKQDEALQQMTTEEINKKLAALDEQA